MATRTKKEYVNGYFKVRVFDKGCNLRSSYDYADIEEIFLATPFDKMPIPVNVYNNEYYDDIEMRGNTHVGYITGYDPETREFDVTVLEKYVKTVETYNNPIVYPRVRVVNGKVTQVLGLDLCQASYYASLYK